MATAQELIASAKQQAEENQTFTVPFAGADILFRLPDGATEYESFRRAADKIVKAIQKTPSDVYKPFQNTPAEVIRQAFWIHKLAVEPAFTMLEALELGQCGAALMYLYNETMQHVVSTVMVDTGDMVEELKND